MLSPSWGSVANLLTVAEPSLKRAIETRFIGGSSKF